MKKLLWILVFVIFLSLFTEGTTFAAKKKEVVNIKAIYELDNWIGTNYELFLKEYKLKMPKKIGLNFASSTSEFFTLANVKVDLGAITIQGVIVISGDKVTPNNRVAILKELIRVTLEDNNKGKDADKIINDFFKKYGIK